MGMGSIISMFMKRRQAKGPSQTVSEDLLRAMLAVTHDVRRPLAMRERNHGASLRVKPLPKPGQLRMPPPLAALGWRATAHCNKPRCTLGGIGRAHRAPQNIARHT